MFKKTFINLLVAFLVILSSCGLAGATVVTVSTFADPAVDGSMSLFTVDLNNDLITGGWADSQLGLTLQIPYSGHTYTDAFFTMTDVSYTGGVSGGETGGGTIKFFADGQDTGTTPLIQIIFGEGQVAPFGFGAMDMFYFNDVTITGSEITGSLMNESFAFSFSNQVPLQGSWDNGYMATASFTSSAEVPEPATFMLLGLGALGLFRRKHKV